MSSYMFGKKDSDKNVGGNELVPMGIFRNAESATPKFSADNVKPNHQNLSDELRPQAIFTDAKLENKEYLAAKAELIEKMMARIEFGALEQIPTHLKKLRVRDVAAQIITQEIHIPLTSAQIEMLKEQAVDDMLGFGPLEMLIADPDVSDIMINGSKRIFVEKNGKVQLTDVTFMSEKHLLNTVQKIVSLVGRRVDESSPMVDARMPDGSRFNAIIPPLALDGSLISIRKFRKSKITLKEYIDFGSMIPEMADFLAICGAIRLNIIISGGTGSGKTTLLNAISGNIDINERVITIEDAAELQLQQPHVLRTETRPPNMQGAGEITARQLVKNALRMRPDRIIIGEIRGEEVIDVLSAMNTGHDGSMATIHANTPRDALSRIENLIGMSKVSIALNSLRTQIASAVNLIVQVARQRDGKRRITHIEEVIGIEGDTILTQQLFGFKAGQMGEDGVLTGEFFCTGAIPKFIEQAAYFGKDKEMLNCIGKNVGSK